MKKLRAGYSKRADGRLEYRFTIEGKRYSVYGKTEQECQTKRNMKTLKLAQEWSTNPHQIDAKHNEYKLSDIYGMWAFNRKGTIQESTKYTNDRRWKAIFNIIGDKLVRELSTNDILNARNEMHESGRFSTSTINDIVVQFYSIMDYAMKLGVIQKNPCTNIRPLIRTEPEATDTNHRALTLKEQELFFKYAKISWYYPYYAFLVQTGLRCGEASALSWDDVDFENNIIHITKTWSRIGHSEWELRNGLKTKAGKRDIPMTEGIRKTLLGQLELQADKVYNDNLNLVFRSTTGDWVQRNTTNYSIKHILWRIAEDENVVIPMFTNHALRATFATRAIENGMEPDVLRTILGHSKIATTLELYNHVLLDRKRREMDYVNMEL